MAVYTQLNSKDISDFLKNYNIGDLVSFKGIIDGIDNSNFIIETSIGRYILTIFESRINKNELPFFINLKKHLAGQDICCPEPIQNNSGHLINDLKDKPALIVSFLNGAILRPQQNGIYNNITTKHCFEIGRNLAILHLGSSNFEEFRENDLGVARFDDLFNKMQYEIENYEPGLCIKINQYLSLIKTNWRDNLKSGAVHVDLFPDNVFFDENAKVSGVIDFYFAANDLLIYDLAIVINAWCFNQDNQLNQEKYNQVLKGYEEVRKLPDEEKSFLPTALLAASVRFLLTRLYDKFNTPSDSLVNIKDPQEYIQKAHFFSKNLNS